MDMLVPLYKLGGVEERLRRIAGHGIVVRRAMAHERRAVVRWVRRTFESEGPAWGDECEHALSGLPIRCHIATRGGEVLGFACFDATAKGVFGPTGTDRELRGLGVGAALLVVSLNAMREAGYAYAVIGGAGEHVRGFYEKVAGAIAIADSEPGMYRDPLSPADAGS